MGEKARKRNKEMYEAILSLGSYKECCSFFDDLCTSKELEAMEQRYEVATMLRQQKVYIEIMKEPGASSATISRVKRMLNDGTGTLGKKIDRQLKDQKAES